MNTYLDYNDQQAFARRKRRAAPPIAFSRSYWLTAAIESANKRDLVDALDDAEALVRLLQASLGLGRAS